MLILNFIGHVHSDSQFKPLKKFMKKLNLFENKMQNSCDEFLNEDT